MVQKSPLVIVNGRLTELQPGDSVEGAVFGTVTAGSGLIGGGDLNTGTKRLDVALADNASGLIFVGDSVGYDGRAEVTADIALATGVAAIEYAEIALQSGSAAVEFAEEALASGNLALENATNAVSYSNIFTFTSDSDLEPGDAVGFNSAGNVQKLNSTQDNTLVRTSVAVPFNGENKSYLKFEYNSTRKHGIITGYQSSPAGHVSQAVTSYEGRLRVDGPVSPVINSGNATDAFELANYKGAGTYMYIGYNPSITANSRYRYTGVAVVSGVVEDWSRSSFACTANYKPLDSRIRSSTNTFRYPTSCYDTHMGVQHYVATSGSAQFGTCLRGISSLGNSSFTIAGIQVYDSTKPTILGDSVGAKRVFTQNELCFHEGIGSGIYLYADGGRSNYANSSVTTPEWKNNPGPTNAQFNLVFLSGQYVSEASATVTNPGFTGLKPVDINSCYVPSINKCAFIFEQDEKAGDPAGLAFATYYEGTVYSGFQGENLLDWEGVFDVGSGCSYPRVTYDSTYQQLIVTYRSSQTPTSSYLVAHTVTPVPINSSGHTVEVSPQYVITSSNVSWLAPQYCEDIGQTAVLYSNSTNSRCEIATISPSINRIPQTRNSLEQDNFLGVSTQTVSSGDSVVVAMPNTTSQDFENLVPGANYFLDSISGNLNTAPTLPPNWSGGSYTSFLRGQWTPVGKALTSSGMYLTNTL